MSNRTWACIECGKTYRRDQSYVGTVRCALCGKECEYVHWKMRVPSPRKQKEWKRFWSLYRREKAELERCFADGNIEIVELDLLNMRIMPRSDQPKKP